MADATTQAALGATTGLMATAILAGAAGMASKNLDDALRVGKRKKSMRQARDFHRR